MSAPNVPLIVEAEQTFIRLPTRLDWIQPTVEYLRQKALLCGACHESRASKLTIALHEALNNSVIHGNLELSSELRERDDNSFARALADRASDPRYASRTVDIHVDYDGTRIQWSITDEGPGFDTERLLKRDPEAPSELLLASGRGILIMKTFLDEVRYDLGGRRLVLALRRSSGEEKREHTRLPLEKRVRVSPIRADGTVDWNAAYDAVTRNFSQQGLSLLQARLAQTDRILIGIEIDGQPLYVPVEIRHSRPVGEDMVELGCRFQGADPQGSGPATDVSSAALTEALGDLIERLRAQQTVHDNRRAYPRVGYTEPITVHGPTFGEVAGYARDISKSGIAFIATRPLPEELVLLHLPQHNGSPLKVKAQIVRCLKIMDGYYDVGAMFLGVVDAS